MFQKSLRYSLLAIFAVVCGIAHAQTADLSKLSLRLTDWVYQNENTNATRTIGVALTSSVDIHALDQQMYAEKATPAERTRRVKNALMTAAEATQPNVKAWLSLVPGVDLSNFKSYWVGNILFLDATSEAIKAMTLNPAIDFVDFDAQLAYDEPSDFEILTNDNTRGASVNGHEPGHDAIGAPTMWSMGYSGRGRLVFGIDTGVDITHPALGYKWQGNFKPDDQAWFDQSGNYPSPLDCGGGTPHGTHTMGTMVGLDPATNDTIGVAPAARWVAAPGICSGNSTSARIAAFQWAIDPDGDPNTTSDQPDAICNSWFDPNTVNECNGNYRATFDAVEAAGIAVVFSAGNSGASASTITQPKNINNDTVSVFCVGATATTAPYAIANFSSRGPSTCGGSGTLQIKPEVSAPGVSVRSSIDNQGYGNLSGTSMAAPHVCGAILLLKEAFPFLTGRQLKMALWASATDLGQTGEDNTYGTGIINVPAAYNYLIAQGHVPETYGVDAGLVSVDDPGVTTCNQDIAPEIVIENGGTSPLTSLTIEYRFDGVSALSTFNWTGSIAAGQTATVTLPSTNLSIGNYTFEAYTSNPNGTVDTRPFNDCIFYDFEIISGPTTQSPITQGCPGFVYLNVLNVPPNTAISWYTQQTGGSLLGTGNNLGVSAVASTSYWGEITYNRYVGEPDNQSGTGGFFANSNRWLVFDAYQDFTIKSVRVFADGAGNRTIRLRNSANQVLAQTTVNIPNGDSRVTLNFNVPAGTDHQLQTQGGADLYRHNSGLSYPYTIADVVSITRSNASNPTGFYYFFYDWEIEYNSPCGRAEVVVDITGNAPVASFTQSATVVDLSSSGTVNFTDNSSPAASTWAWDFGDGGTSTQQNPSHTYTAIGTYTVTLVVDPLSSCPSTSTSTVEVINTVGVEPASNSFLEVYPNPTDGQVKVHLQREQDGEVHFSLFNALGAKVMEQSIEGGREMIVPLDLNDLSAGTYFLHVRQGEEVMVRQIARN